MRRVLSIAALALSLGLLAVHGQAQNRDVTARLKASDEPVHMTAKGGLRVDLKKRIGIAKGDVVITRSDVTVCCDKATARYSGNKVDSVECEGNVVVLRPDGTRARADKAVFDAAKDRVTLKGKAKLRSAAADLQGDAIIYDIAEDKLDVRGDKSRFSFAPQNQPPLPLDRKCP